MPISEGCKGLEKMGYKIENNNGSCTYEGGGGPYIDSCSGCLYTAEGGVQCSPPGSKYPPSSNMDSKETCNVADAGFSGTFCWCPDPTLPPPTPYCPTCGPGYCCPPSTCIPNQWGEYCRPPP